MSKLRSSAPSTGGSSTGDEAVPTHQLTGEVWTLRDRRGVTFGWDIDQDAGAVLDLGSESILEAVS